MIRKNLFILVVLVICLVFSAAEGALAFTGSDANESISFADENSVSMENFTVELDHYIVNADGSAHFPEVTKVYLYASEDLGVYKDIFLSKDEYEVFYTDFEGNPVSEIKAVGDYLVNVKARGGFKHNGKIGLYGKASIPYTVLGKRQRLEVNKTKLELGLGDEGFKLEPVTDGDATGFIYESSDEDVVLVSDDGLVNAVGVGIATISIETVGSTLYESGKVRTTVRVSPGGVEKVSAKKKSKTSILLSWAKDTAKGSYQVYLSTGSSFKKSKTEVKKTSKDKLTLKNLKAGKTYYLKVRKLATFVDARENKHTLYGPWSKVFKIRL